MGAQHERSRARIQEPRPRKHGEHEGAPACPPGCAFGLLSARNSRSMAKPPKQAKQGITPKKARAKKQAVVSAEKFKASPPKRAKAANKNRAAEPTPISWRLENAPEDSDQHFGNAVTSRHEIESSIRTTLLAMIDEGSEEIDVDDGEAVVVVRFERADGSRYDQEVTVDIEREVSLFFTWYSTDEIEVDDEAEDAEPGEARPGLAGSDNGAFE